MSVMESHGRESEFGETFIFARRPAARNRGEPLLAKRRDILLVRAIAFQLNVQ